jgi:5-methyltetrahydrofolate--homocysteine methyltransferase
MSASAPTSPARRSFRKLIEAGDYTAALDVAREQVENGAQIIDVNMDEGLLDSEAGDGDVPQPDRRRARHRPRAGHDRQLEVERDRGRPEVRAGQAVVNSISMKEGEEKFLDAGPLVRATAPRRRDGVRRAGPGRHLERKVEICKRAYDILVEQVGFPPEDIIFDPNIFASRPASRSTTTTASTSSRRRAGSRQNLPAPQVSGGVSNLSFSFRGNEPVREAMHSVFLYHAIKAGMDMGIVNAGQLASTTTSPELRERVEDVSSSTAARRHRAAARVRREIQGGKGKRQRSDARPAWREWPVASGCPRAGARHHRLHRRRHRGGAPAVAAGSGAARRDRRPADGRHERRRRPVRRRQDVPAAGGEVARA